MTIQDSEHSPPTDEEGLLRATVTRVVYRNPDNGYVVLRVEAPSHPDLVVVGSSAGARSGSEIVARGKFTEHPKYGSQFQAISITEAPPTSPDKIEKYLCSGIVKGIGPKTAAKIVSEFGDETLQTIESDVGAIAAVSGVGLHKAELLQHVLSQGKAQDEVRRFLIENNITPHLAERIYDRYESKSVELISENPYRLADEMWGVGFLTADTVARQFGFEPHCIERLRAGLRYVLLKSRDTNGHCYLPSLDLSEKARSMLELDPSIDLLAPLEDLKQEGLVVQEGERIYLNELLEAETAVSEFVRARLEPRPEALVDERSIASTVRLVQDELQMSLSEDQKGAITATTTHRLSVITGGPGCGKTTVVRGITTLFEAQNKVIRLCAPTGRAAQRLAEVCGMPASTIHRLLGFVPGQRAFKHNTNDPIIADIIIVDESSMIDIQLAQHLFAAIGEDTTVVLVGDSDQLPSVGPGRVLNDILGSPPVKRVVLSELFRRAEASSITSVAYQINHGTVPDIPSPDGVTKSDSYHISRSDPEECLRTVESLFADQIPRKFGFERNEIAILTPSNRGPLGTISLNDKLQAKVNPPSDPEQELEIGETTYRVGDRVCQRKNNYQLHDAGVFNGDIGNVFQIDRKEGTMTVELWDGRLIEYDRKTAAQLSLAYAMTVHRAQGAEFPCVVVILHSSHYPLLERQLLYTAVTRAKKLLIVCGMKQSMTLACRRTQLSKRYTSLARRIITDDESALLS